MTAQRDPPRLAFDYELCLTPALRAFWGTICETVPIPLILTPTSAEEALVHGQRLAKQEWRRKLRALNDERSLGWQPLRIDRVSGKAAIAERDYLDEQLRSPDGPYRLDQQVGEQTVERLVDIPDALPDSLFDFSRSDALVDRGIVIEALAGGYDLLLSHNIRSMDVIGLTQWLRAGEGARMGIVTRILDPAVAVEILRGTRQLPRTWLAGIAARSSVSDPSDPDRSALEMARFLHALQRWRLDDIHNHLCSLLTDEPVFLAALEEVRRTGASAAYQLETQCLKASRATLSRRTGLPISTWSPVPFGSV